MGITTSLKERKHSTPRPLRTTPTTRLRFGKVNVWMRHHPGSQTSPSQQAFDTISRSSHVPLGSASAQDGIRLIND